ncbi:CDC27 family protein [uncultured Methanobrevibacter sp.]|uniref:CDC27 family protein n=1 Tax=uncultured Methanobrevibacter sp. TaxID=253161 RepID=UPI0034588CEA
MEDDSECDYRLYEKILQLEENQSEDYKKLLNHYNKFLQINPSNLSVLDSKATLLYRLNLFEDAIDSFDEYLKLNPNKIRILYQKAVSLEKLSRLDEALLCYDKILDLDSKHINSLYNKALIFMKLSDYNKVIRIYDEILRIKPDCEKVRISRDLVIKLCKNKN